MSLIPKNLDKMREKLVHQLDGPTPESIEARVLIDQCQQIEKELAQEPSRLLTIDQAAERLGVSQQTLRNWERDGRITCTRTTGSVHGHRRYREDHINDLRRRQASMSEIIFLAVSVSKLKTMAASLIEGFKDDDKVNLSISQGIDNRVKITVDSEDGLTTTTKAFSVKED